MKKALIIGVGPINGLGAALAEKFAQNGLEIFISGRTESSLKKVSKYLAKKGYKINPIVADATEINQLNCLFDQIDEGSH